MDARRLGGGKKIVKQFSEEGFLLRLVLVPCGKRNCTRCPHGPYWYAYFFRRGKVKELYIGRHLRPWFEGKGREWREKLQRWAELEDLEADRDGTSYGV